MTFASLPENTYTTKYLIVNKITFAMEMKLYKPCDTSEDFRLLYNWTVNFKEHMSSPYHRVKTCLLRFFFI